VNAKTDWVYSRVVNKGNVIFPRMPFWLGQVELSKMSEADGTTADALVRSLHAYALAPSEPSSENALVCARVLVLDDAEADARRYGNMHVVESVRAYRDHVLPLMPIHVTDAGCMMDLKTREVVPLLPNVHKERGYGAAATFDELARHPLHTLNLLFAAPAKFGALGAAFRRSSHWRDLAVNGLDEGQTLLLHWMAAECLCKVRRDEDIVPKLLACLGFPLGQTARRVGTATMKRLVSLPNYRSWRERLADCLGALRVARNHIVHAGYRDIDLSALLRADQRHLGMRMLAIVSHRLAEFALSALNLLTPTVEDMWCRYEHLTDGQLETLARWAIDRASETTPRRRWAR
jgi:hypothetical protein